MAEKNTQKDQKARSWGEKLRDVFGKKLQPVGTAEQAVHKLRKRKGRP